VHADVVRIRLDDGRERSIIGRVVSAPEAHKVVIGDWPDGGHPQDFRRDEVTVRRQGVVRDFIKFVPDLPAWVPGLGGREAWPWVFNVADAALVCGVVILLLHSLLDRRSGPDTD
jgi:hypothetical protein